MGVIREVIYEINFYSPPLRKHRYLMTSVERQHREHTDGGTGVLFDEMHRRDQIVKKASGILTEPSEPEETGVQDVPAAAEAQTETHTPKPDEVPVNPVTGLPISIEKKEEPKRKFRSLKRLEDMIYDNTAEKIAELEDEAFLQLNADGYYDEILPDDADQDIPIGESLPVKQIAILVSLTVVLAAVLIWSIRGIF